MEEKRKTISLSCERYKIGSSLKTETKCESGWKFTKLLKENS